MNELLRRLRDKGNTVLVVEHKPETIAIADHVVDLGPGAGAGGGTVCFEGSVAGLRGSGTVTGRRETDDGVTVLTAELPVVVSVSEKINEPRYPSFKGIMAAKKKPATTLTVADLGLDPATVGAAGALTTVTAVAPRPPKSAGEKVVDDGDGGTQVAAFLVAHKLV